MKKALFQPGLSNVDLAKLLTQASQQNIRIPVIIRQTDFSQLTLPLNPKNVLIISTADSTHYHRYLGSEFSHLVIHYNSKMSANMLFSLFGTIKGGGLILVVLPDDFSANAFELFLFSALADIFNQQSQIGKTSIADNEVTNNISLSSEQQTAINSLVDSETISILIGQRGRGKSTILGFVTNELLERGKRVIISAPSKKAAANIFRYVSRGTSEEEPANVSRETILFCAPENLLDNIENYDYCIIDEAASLPSNILNKVLACKNKLVFSTTIEGYEGQGEGFRLNFIENSDRPTNLIHLKMPYRFSSNDPIETFFNQTFLSGLSDKKTTENSKENNPLNDYSDGIHLVDFKDINTNQAMLIFNHLKTAHYRTTPNDFASLLNGDYQVYIYVQAQQLIGVCQVLVEEKINESIVDEIILGNRRPPGNLTVQSLLTSHDDLAKPLTNLKIGRIVRIAIAKQYQRQGIGSQFLQAVENNLRDTQFDLISTSYSGSEKNIKFWQQNNYQLLRVGIKTDKWNDNYAILSAKCLTNDKEVGQVINQIQAVTKAHLAFYQGVLYSDSLVFSFIKGKANDSNNIPINSYSIDKAKTLLLSHKDLAWLAPQLASILAGINNEESLRLLAELKSSAVASKSVRKAYKRATFTFLEKILQEN